MSVAILNSPRTVARNRKLKNIAGLLKSLGSIPAKRVRMWPPPGTAMIDDLSANNDNPLRTCICELIDGTLVEKTVGARESKAALLLGMYTGNWNDELNLGYFLGEAGIVQVRENTGLGADLAFYRWDQYPDLKAPTEAVPLTYPDLAVEILSKSNTKKEMARKRKEYFAAGTRIVWEVDLKKQVVDVYHDPDNFNQCGIDDTLDGESVMPGFSLSIRKWFERVDRQA